MIVYIQLNHLESLSVNNLFSCRHSKLQKWPYTAQYTVIYSPITDTTFKTYYRIETHINGMTLNAHSFSHTQFPVFQLKRLTFPIKSVLHCYNVIIPIIKHWGTNTLTTKHSQNICPCAVLYFLVTAGFSSTVAV